ncbi:pyridoxamine 5'-phosphate oxidase family protein [Kaistella polysaccharea]|uniref:pyridoxamine 5'-phosphate oxidase family protein n=1 Tax=Kaistella polysaccharea TaxID=2878534 RepID=UPI001CF5270F|nr:pyridoxamine 5'-phosphate oxidase family protein [Kaistella polysaccharea]
MGQAQSPHQDLSGNSAIKKIKELAEEARTCFFTTKIGNDAHSVPMSLQEVDEDGVLWFISSSESEHNEHIMQDSAVQLYFMNNSSYEYVFVKGSAKITTDKILIDKYWSDFANAWFDVKDDPKVTLIGVKAQDGYYYETKDNKVFAMAKMVFAAVTGSKTEDGGIEGGLNI